MEHRTLIIDGMSCGHCVARVKKVLEAVAGLTVGEVQIGSARVSATPDVLETAIKALDEAGYPARAAQ